MHSHEFCKDLQHKGKTKTLSLWTETTKSNKCALQKDLPSLPRRNSSSYYNFILLGALLEMQTCSKWLQSQQHCSQTHLFQIQNLTKQLGRRICRKRFCQLFKQEFVRVLKRNRMIYCKQQQNLFLTYVTDIHAFNQQTQRLWNQRHC